MTTVIAVEGEYVTKFVADSQCTYGSQQSDDSVKIAKNGEYTFAVAGALRAMQIIEFAKLPPIPHTQINGRTDLQNSTLDRFFSLEIIPAIVSAFKECVRESSLRHSSILVALKNRVYEVAGGDGAWLRYKTGHYGIGSGSSYALGALAAGANPEDAVSIASDYDTYTNLNLTVVEARA